MFADLIFLLWHTKKISSKERQKSEIFTGIFNMPNTAPIDWLW